MVPSSPPRVTHAHAPSVVGEPVDRPLHQVGPQALVVDLGQARRARPPAARRGRWSGSARRVPAAATNARSSVGDRGGERRRACRPPCPRTGRAPTGSSTGVGMMSGWPSTSPATRRPTRSSTTRRSHCCCGMLLDQQYPMEHAFRGPAKMLDRFGSLEPAEIAAADPEQFASLCSEPPAVHRFPGSMAAEGPGGGAASWSRSTTVTPSASGPRPADAKDLLRPDDRAARLRQAEGADLRGAAGQAARRTP